MFYIACIFLFIVTQVRFSFVQQKNYLLTYLLSLWWFCADCCGFSTTLQDEQVQRLAVEWSVSWHQTKLVRPWSAQLPRLWDCCTGV